MTIYYVRESGSWTPSSPYNSWSTAASDVDNVIALTGDNDEVRIESTYIKDWGADKSIDWGGTRNDPVKIISCTTSDVYQRGATLKTTGGDYYLYLSTLGEEYFGFDFENSGTDYFKIQTNSSYHRFNDCHIKATYIFSLNGSDSDVVMDNGTIIENTSTYSIDLNGYALRATFRDCIMNLSNSGTGYVFRNNATAQIIIVEYCDLSNDGANSTGYVFNSLDETNSSGGSVKNCRLVSGMELINGLIVDRPLETRFTMSGCYSGTDTVPSAWRLIERQRYGTVTAVSSEYRSNGASDGETSYSWEMAAYSNKTGVFPLISPPMILYVNAGSQTITLYFASDTTLYSEQFWVEVYSANESIPAYAQGKVQTTHPERLDTWNTQNTTDSVSTWNGSGVGTKYKASFTINPTEAGIVVVKAFLAVFETVYIDPTPVVS